MTKIQDLTSGDVRAAILRFAAPLFLSQLFQQLYNSVDSLIVGNYLGKQALAAVSSSGSLILLLVGFFSGISVGAGVVISRYYGAREQDRVELAIHTDIAFGLCAGAFLTVFGILATPLLLRWMGTAPDVIDGSVRYFRFYFLGAVPLVMYNTLTGVMRALGDGRRPLLYLVFSSLLNVALDLLFVGKLRLGVGSAAAATAIAQGVSMLLCFAALARGYGDVRVRWRKIRFDRALLREIVRNGVPAGVQTSVISLANVTVQSYINSFGSDAMAACGSYSKLEGFCFLPVTSFSAALTTVISQNLGAKRYDRAKRAARFGIVFCAVMAELIGLTIALFAPALIGVFNGDPRVIAVGVRQCRTELPFFFLLSFSHCVAGVCRGAGKAKVPMFIMLSTWCVFRILYLTVTMRLAHRIQLLFFAYPITWSLSSVLFLLYLRRSDWIHGFDD